MNNTSNLATAATTTRPNRFVERLLADRHSIPLSIALHLVPGALIVTVYAFVSAPLVRAIEYPPFMAWAIALAVVLFPIQFGLLWLGKQRTGKYSLRGALHYMDRPVSRGKVTAFIVFCLLWMTIVSLSLLPLDDFLYENAFSWIRYEGTGSSATTYLNGYSQQMLLVTFLICGPFTGWVLPLIEEYYFRGFLLPRLPQLGKWAPLFNMFLFSVYHFWAPWTVLSKLVFLFPGIWFAWKKQDIRISIGMHPGSALLITVVGVTAIALGYTSL
ncbi:CPBP family intramembrane glutamic endopeptidase [Glycomyces buryatensis]|uniref:CPBP family intramembrane metalloprotease n=1 Tax=Glycomyces buryatensis TaxID=2570927 RepID=A0A4S8QBL7_9ACTN|nr:CPBP family intramembrane glutamic endopeptidase [Glycomyces buryatensis]THV41670.1 CPBP family intramembrane metalloprotease [Glycomyces buryatensis]